MLKFNVRCVPIAQHDNEMHGLNSFKPALTATTTVIMHTTQFCGKRAFACRTFSPALQCESSRQQLLMRLSVGPGYSGG